jgi:hypothetical protein
VTGSKNYEYKVTTGWITSPWNLSIIEKCWNFVHTVCGNNFFRQKYLFMCKFPTDVKMKEGLCVLGWVAIRFCEKSPKCVKIHIFCQMGYLAFFCEKKFTTNVGYFSNIKN